MTANVKLSEYCLVSHQEWMNDGGPVPKFTPWTPFRNSLSFLDPKVHFTGLRGATWRAFGVDRSVKNPNLCNS
jgi:hypothetical protein